MENESTLESLPVSGGDLPDNKETLNLTLSPCLEYSRNFYGLIEGVDYKFTEENLIDWRAMIDPAHLVPNREKFKDKTNEEIDVLDVSTLDDSQVLILLIGLKRLARLRGYNYVRYEPLRVENGYVSMVCEIEFIGNYETDGRPIKFQSVANANFENVTSTFQPFLETFAENRAFARCVRNFLNISIVSREEMGKMSTDHFEGKALASPSLSDPTSVLKQKVADLNWSFDEFKKKIIESNERNKKVNEQIEKLGGEGKKENVIAGVDDWAKYEDVPKGVIFILISRLENYKKKLMQKK